MKELTMDPRHAKKETKSSTTTLRAHFLQRIKGKNHSSRHPESGYQHTQKRNENVFTLPLSPVAEETASSRFLPNEGKETKSPKASDLKTPKPLIISEDGDETEKEEAEISFGEVDESDHSLDMLFCPPPAPRKR